MAANEFVCKGNWDLSKIFPSIEKYEDAIQEVESLLLQLVAMQGQLLESAENLIRFLQLEEQMHFLLERVYVYSYLCYYSDVRDSKANSLKEKADSLALKVQESLSFVNTELLNSDYSEILAFMDTHVELQHYASYLKRKFRYQKYRLSEEQEKNVSFLSSFLENIRNIFVQLNEADATFAAIYLDGEKVEIKHGNYLSLMKNTDSSVRREVFLKYHQYYKERNHTFAALYQSQIKGEILLSQLKGFSTPLEMYLYAEDVPVHIYKNLIDVTHRHIDSLHQYISLRKDMLGLQEQHMYDIYVDYANSCQKRYTYEDAVELVCKALEPLGEEYIRDLKMLFSSQVIDPYSRDGKRTVPYEYSMYGELPYVSLHFDGTLYSVVSMAHELGHAMHSYYSGLHQNFCDWSYPSFIGEISAMVNENLLVDYLVTHAKNDEEKLVYLLYFLDNFRISFFRQTMFAEFEKNIHEKVQNGEHLSGEQINSIYFDLNQYYYGSSIVSDDMIQYEWSRCPHFYKHFYVYKYAFGYSAAISISSRLLLKSNSIKDNYLRFLQAGGSKSPSDLLKICHIAIEDEQLILESLLVFNRKLDEARELFMKRKEK